jgi:hypothetical protein
MVDLIPYFAGFITLLFSAAFAYSITQARKDKD